MNHQILITGSSGLVGSDVARVFAQSCVDVVRFDLRGHGAAQGAVRDRDRVAEAVAGVIHFVEVLRVIWSDGDPDGCWTTNVGGTRNVLRALQDEYEPIGAAARTEAA